MPGWNDIFQQLRSAGSAHDMIRRDYLRQLHEYTGRNTIYYYSAWLEKNQLLQQGVTGFQVSDNDKDALMATIHSLDRSKGLDLVLHTPGGGVAATESIVEYLRQLFGNDVRAIVPHMAMSAGTMIALSCKEIVMGHHSALGPIDPQIMGIPAHGVVEEFERARADITENPATIALWQPIIAKYTPTLIGECEKAIAWSNEMVAEWLRTGMFKDLDEAKAAAKVQTVMQAFGDHALNKSHSRHIGIERARQAGLRVTQLEDDQELQERLLTVHHTYVQTASETNIVRIVENHLGVAHVTQVQIAMQMLPQQSAVQMIPPVPMLPPPPLNTPNFPDQSPDVSQEPEPPGED